VEPQLGAGGKDRTLKQLENTYWDWMVDHAYIASGAQAAVGRFLATFRDFPPSQRPASFTIDQAMEKLKQTIGN
jgi:hypothetical protein